MHYYINLGLSILPTFKLPGYDLENIQQYAYYMYISI